MGRRDELIELYAQELTDKLGETPDMDLLTKVVIGLGPAVYQDDSSLVAGSDKQELETVRTNFLIGKLGLADSPALMEGIEAVLARYGTANRHKHRAVVYYLLTRHFGAESAYG
jgi:hypothetical protein